MTKSIMSESFPNTKKSLKSKIEGGFILGVITFSKGRKENKKKERSE
jgi:hypothetical protein